jgi:hypothetical protein
MQQENKNFGILFDSINLLSEEHLEVILSTMNKDYAIYYLIEAVKSSYNRGSFSIGETEVLSKAIRILSKEESVSE